MNELERLSPKEEFLKQFQDNFQEQYLPDKYTPEQKNEIIKHTSKSRIKTSMFMSIPMHCKGPDCSFADTCPLQQQNIAPVGNACSLELGMIANFMGDYIEELDINPDNLVELSQVRDLVDLEVQYIRKSKMLAKEDFITENVAGIDSDGDPIMRKELHLAVTYEDGILKKKAVIWKQMIATREAKAKTGIAAMDSATTMSALVEMNRTLNQQREDLLKQELGIVDEDDYIEEGEVIEDEPEFEEPEDE